MSAKERAKAKAEDPQATGDAVDQGAADEVAEQVPAEVPEDVDSLKKALAEEREKAEQYLANWQRAQADFINYRKRTEQEKAESIRYANSVLIADLLPVVDDLERAIESRGGGGADETWAEGVDLIYRKLMSVLEGRGLKRIRAEGEEFDPNFHEGVMQEEGEEGKVLEELQKGYLLGDRLLRPAQVKVGRGTSGDA